MEAIYHAEGRITPVGASYQYEYNIKDHLGNTRLTFADLNANGVVDVPSDILQENHYYPFGLKMNYTWMDNVALDNKYQYNGKEFNDDLGLNWNDYGARWYDASLGRWESVDPLAEKYASWSGYNYCFNNSILFLDPDGMSSEKVDPTNVIDKDEDNETNYHQQLIDDLRAKTGVEIKVGEDGNWVAASVDENVGSETAREHLLNAINSEKTITLIDNRGHGNEVERNADGTATNNFKFDGADVEYFIENTFGMDKTTNGFAMVFLHELQHTEVGGGLLDTDKMGQKGPTVKIVNKMLRELNLHERESYQVMSAGSGTYYYIPYSKEVKENIEKGIEPMETQPHVRIHRFKIAKP